MKVIWDKDLAADSPVPWYLPLDKYQLSLTGFRCSAVGRFITRNMVRAVTRLIYLYFQQNNFYMILGVEQQVLLECFCPIPLKSSSGSFKAVMYRTGFYELSMITPCFEKVLVSCDFFTLFLCVCGHARVCKVISFLFHNVGMIN